MDAKTAIAGPMPERLRLRAEVTAVRRADGRALLTTPDGTTIRISGVGLEVLPQLIAGTGLDALTSSLKQRYPVALDLERKLEAFLLQLSAAGLFDAGVSRPRPRAGARIALWNPDPLARYLALRISRVPRWLRRGAIAAVLFAAALGLWGVLAAGVRVHPAGLVTDFDLLGALIFLAVVVPLHELAHAVACRAAGAPVSGAGVIFHGYLVPGPYVDTTQAYRVASRWRRFLIPAAGPAIDMCAATVSAWTVAVTGGVGAMGSAALYVLLLSLASLVFGTNPLVASDGSHMIEALLDDELARTNALSWRPRGRSSKACISRYRWACMAHVSLAALLAGWTWLS